MKIRRDQRPGSLCPVAVYQAEKKRLRLEREAAKRQEEEWANVGEWSPEDEIPDPDE